MGRGSVSRHQPVEEQWSRLSLTNFKLSQILSAHLQIPLHHCKHAFDTHSMGTLYRELLSAKSHVRGEEDEDGCILGFLYYYLGRLSTVTIWSYGVF